ncbi:hypothetical protein ACMFMG_011398 [Clarireedia jacksonii]
MQASPLPPQQPQPMPGAPSNENPQQNMNSNPHFQPNNMPPQPQNGPQRPANGPQPNPAEAQMIGREAFRLFNEASAEEKNTVRATMQSRIDPAQWQRYTSQGTDPALLFFRQQAYHKWRINAQAQMAQGQQNPQGQQAPLSQQPQNGPAAAPAMQQQRSMNPSPMNGQSQPPTSMGGTDMAFMENLIGQQQQAGVIAQEAGQMVVPVSGPRNGTPQPNVVMPGQSMNMNDQRSAAMSNQRGQMTPAQMFNAQNQRMQQAQAQQQSQQAHARANAAAKAQHMGLQGQPGGMGPMPPQQSPAMNTLNTPLRTPSQQMNHPEGMRMNGNPQFNPSLDPRFVQGMQRPMGPGNAMNGLNPAMFQGMPPEQQKQFAALPPDKLNEVVQKWHAAQNARMQGGHQMPMPGGNQQPRPGQLGPQAGQFTPQQQALNQFMMANPGQRPPPSLMAGMTPQQQMYLQQSVAQASQTAMQRRPDNPQFDQRALMQLDNMPFPPGVLNIPQMPRGIPAEVKKWGQLKHWLATNGNIPPEVMENLKNTQKMHYMDFMRRSKLLGPQAPQIGMNPGGPGAQNPMPVVTPGLAAPVAPMGQAPMQMPNGMNMVPQALRQPTPQDVLAIRNHPSGRFIGFTDEQLRTFIMRQQEQQLQLQHQQRMHMANRIAQINVQQPRPNPPNGPANGNQASPAQQPPVQATQPKPPTSEPAATAAAAAVTAVNASRARQQQQPNQKPTPAQTSSPAQPAKNNLKRASSDDVVEVPNPNGQQRPAQQTAQKPPVLRTLPPEAVAKLTPDRKKQYEALLRQQYAARQQQNINSEDAAKLREIMTEENQRAMEHLPDIPMDQETKKTMVTLLRDIVNPTNNLGRAIHKWYAVTHDDTRARIFFRTRNRLAKQFKDKELREVKDVFSIRPAEVEQALNMLRGMIKDLTDRFPTMKKSEATPNTSVSQAPAPATQSSEAVPLNAANLQQQQQQLNKMHQRSNSRSSHPPAAPTSSQPPFPFGASSPHGQPIYNVKAPGLTQENLHIPARKKQKPNSTPVQSQGTPGSTSSPQVSKAVSPEIKRQQQPTESRAPPKPALCCPDQDCERHDVGFETEEELKRHKEEEHVKPLANPQQYAEESLASMLGLDQGQSKKSTTASAPNTTAPPTSTKMTATGSKQGQTPKIEAATPSAMASTPMNRQVSMNRQGSSADSKTLAVKPQPSTPMDISKSQKDNSAVSAQPPAELIVDPWANATIDPHDLFQTFSGFESGAGGAISDMNVYRAITPNDTPESSKDGVSEPNSDISEGVNLDIAVDIFDDSWMPFGPTDTDALSNSNINNFNVSAGDDLTMLDGDIFVPQQSWDDMGDHSIFDKPFKFDTNLYSMDVD